MKNVRIIKVNAARWVVKADTKRFGRQQIMFEGISRRECVAYIKRNGVAYSNLKMQYQGLAIKENNDGTFTVSSQNGKYVDTIDTFGDATMWLAEMGNNSEHGNNFVRRICAKLKCDVEGSDMSYWESDFDEDDEDDECSEYAMV